MRPTAPVTILHTLALSLLAAAAGCRSSPPTTYHLLQPLPRGERSAEERPHADLVAVSLVHFPGYLERVQLVSERAPGTLDVSKTHAWAEPLERGFTRVLAEDLALLLERPVVVIGAMTRAGRAVLSVEVGISRLDVAPRGVVELAATWLAEDGSGTTLVAPRRSFVEVPIDGETPEARVAAMSAAVAGLSREIAAALGETAGG